MKSFLSSCFTISFAASFMWKKLDASCTGMDGLMDGLVSLYRGDNLHDSTDGEIMDQVYGVSFESEKPYGMESSRQVFHVKEAWDIAWIEAKSSIPVGGSSRTMMGRFKQTDPGASIPFGYGTMRFRENFFASILQGPLDAFSIGFFLNDGDNLMNDHYYGSLHQSLLNTWYHVAYTLDGSNNKLTMYVNGDWVKSVTQEGVNTPSDSSVTIGGNFTGFVADFAIFNRTLIASEIEAIYNDPTPFCDDSDSDSHSDSDHTVHPSNSNSESDTDDDYSLPVYNIEAATCNQNTDITTTNSSVVVTCNYQVIIPNGTNIDSNILSPSSCSGSTTVEGVVEKSKPLTNNYPDVSDYEVNIEISPNKVDDVTSILFCLKTEVKDNDGNLMMYRSQLLNTSFDYMADFVFNITSSKFDGFNGTATDYETVDFKVEAFRCTSEKDEDTSKAALKISDVLYVCIKSQTDGIVVNAVTDFTFKKGNAVVYKVFNDNGVMDSNTYIKDDGTDTILVAHLARASLFSDDGIITIEGSVVLGSSGGRRYLARFVQEVTEAEVTTSNFGIEVGVIKAESSANILGTNIFVSHATWISVVAAIASAFY